MVDFSNLIKDPLTSDQYAKEAPSSGGEYLSPGIYDVQIVDIKQDKPLAGDTTWISMKLRLVAADGSGINHSLFIPTAHLTYDKAGMDPKYRYCMVPQLKDFLAGIGEKNTIEDIKTIIPKLFSSPVNLLGRGLKITVGYPAKTFHGEKTDDGVVIVDHQGNKLTSATTNSVITFPDFGAAKMYIEDQNLKLGYVSVLKIDAAKIQESDANSEEW